MDRNLFTYATKELSQDAFICWLLANYDTEELREESYRFINLLMDKNFSYGDIKLMTIKQQERKMDIVIDFWTSSTKTYDSHYLLVVEDKTTSSVHDGQLINYNKIIDHWNIDEPAFELRTRKVLLKSNTLSQQDENEINKTNLNALIKWKKLDIDDLYKGFFSSAKKSKSEVFNMYMEYFTRQYHGITDSPTNNPSSWNFNNWMRFFESFFEEEYKSKYPDAWCSTSIYRGMYPSLCVIFPLIKDHEFHANFEIVVREKLIPFLHPGFRYAHYIDGEKKDRWVWSIEEIIGDESFQVLSQKRLIALRDYLSKNGSNLFHYSGRSRSFAKIDKEKHISYKEKTIEQLKVELRLWFDGYFKVLSKYKSCIANDNEGQ